LRLALSMPGAAKITFPVELATEDTPLALQESTEPIHDRPGWSFEEIARDLATVDPDGALPFPTGLAWQELPSWGSIQVDPDWAAESARLDELFASWAKAEPFEVSGPEATFLRSDWAQAPAFPVSYEEPFESKPEPPTRSATPLLDAFAAQARALTVDFDGDAQPDLDVSAATEPADYLPITTAPDDQLRATATPTDDLPVTRVPKGEHEPPPPAALGWVSHQTAPIPQPGNGAPFAAGPLEAETPYSRADVKTTCLEADLETPASKTGLETPASKTDLETPASKTGLEGGVDPWLALVGEEPSPSAVSGGTSTAPPTSPGWAATAPPTSPGWAPTTPAPQHPYQPSSSYAATSGPAPLAIPGTAFAGYPLPSVLYPAPVSWPAPAFFYAPPVLPAGTPQAAPLAFPPETPQAAPLAFPPETPHKETSGPFTAFMPNVPPSGPGVQVRQHEVEASPTTASGKEVKEVPIEAAVDETKSESDGARPAEEAKVVYQEPSRQSVPGNGKAPAALRETLPATERETRDPWERFRRFLPKRNQEPATPARAVQLPDVPLDEPFIVISSSTYMVEFTNYYTVNVEAADEVVGDEPWRESTSPYPKLYAMVAGQVRMTDDNTVELTPEQVEAPEPEIYSWANPPGERSPGDTQEMGRRDLIRINGWTVFSASNDILPQGVAAKPKRRRQTKRFS
jgi:hypothetical protein